MYAAKYRGWHATITCIAIRCREEVIIVAYICLLYWIGASLLLHFLAILHCNYVRFFNPGMVISFAYPLDVYCEFLIVCITNYYTITIGQQKDVCTITSSFLFLGILTTNNYSDTHHREITTVNTREPWFNTNLIFLQCVSQH